MYALEENILCACPLHRNPTTYANKRELIIKDGCLSFTLGSKNRSRNYINKFDQTSATLDFLVAEQASRYTIAIQILPSICPSSLNRRNSEKSLQCSVDIATVACIFEAPCASVRCIEIQRHTQVGMNSKSEQLS